jgi:hypothetical protein
MRARASSGSARRPASQAWSHSAFCSSARPRQPDLTVPTGLERAGDLRVGGPVRPPDHHDPESLRKGLDGADEVLSRRRSRKSCSGVPHQSRNGWCSRSNSETPSSSGYASRIGSLRSSPAEEKVRESGESSRSRSLLRRPGGARPWVIASAADSRIRAIREAVPRSSGGCPHRVLEPGGRGPIVHGYGVRCRGSSVGFT